ncbi:MAG TPA: PPC domain-containing protein [Planctomycetaceae bacterium]|jgi:hypothetical protein
MMLGLMLLALSRPTFAQTPPEIAYVFPPGGAPGTMVDVQLGGFNWTPDMQLFVHDPRVKLELVGAPGPVIIPYPPYWFGRRARDSDPPLPREFPARLTIGADVPAGFVRWQAANANGATASGVILIATEPEVREIGGHKSAHEHKTPQTLSTLPVAVVGQLSRLEEVDRYQFTAPRTGPVTLDVWTRRLKTRMNAVLEVRDSTGRLVADAADTAGHDLQLTFAAQQGAQYVVSLYDVDFRGYTSYVYRLVIHDGPQVVAAIPAAGKRGETRPVEFLGYGIATGAPQLESVTHNVTFPADAHLQAFLFRLETPHGMALPFTLALSNLVEAVEPPPAGAGQPADARKLAIPAAVTGVLEQQYGDERYVFEGKKGETLRISARSAVAGAPLDLSLAVFDAPGNVPGKELARVDDLPGTLDATLLFPVPADGTYQISVGDISGRSGTRASVYHLQVEMALPDFTLNVPEMLAVPLGGKVGLALKVIRQAGFVEPITLELAGLPAGVTAPAELTIAANKSERAVELTCAADVAVVAGMITVRSAGTPAGQPAIVRSGDVLVAITMKPRVKLVPEGLDDVKKWPRGSTIPCAVFVERLEGFTGPVLLEQTAHQQRSRQGMTGPELTVAPGVHKVDYPVFVPEWMETTKTSRFILNSVVQAPDPKGTVRHLLNKMEMRFGILPVGAMLRISRPAGELHMKPGTPFDVSVSLSRTPELTGDAVLELKLSEELAGRLVAELVTVPAGKPTAVLRITPTAGAMLRGEHELTIRATVLHQGLLPTISETTFVVDFGE